jgi:hypothetical protein
LGSELGDGLEKRQVPRVEDADGGRILPRLHIHHYADRARQDTLFA